MPPIYNYWMGGLQFYLFRLVAITEDPDERARYAKALELCDKARATYEEMMVELQQQPVPVDDFENEFWQALREKDNPQYGSSFYTDEADED